MRAVLAGAGIAAAALLMPSEASAQKVNCSIGGQLDNCTPGSGTPRKGQINQAIADTVAANLKRRGFNTGSPGYVETFNAINDKIVELLTGYNCVNASGQKTWANFLLCDSSAFPSPIQVGADEPFKGGGGDFGGGGATGSWDPFGGEDCGDFRFSLDAQGNLVIPSYVLQVGKPYQATAAGTPISFAGCTSSNQITCDGGNQHGILGADSHEALARRTIHLYNMKRIPQRWFGVIGPVPGLAGCVDGASVAFRDSNGTLYPREEIRQCGTSTLHKNEGSSQSHPIAHKNCPETGDGSSSDFHFYGYTNEYWMGHLHSCIHYYPNPDFGWAGYALNKQTSLPISTLANWPANAPAHVKKCAIDPELIRKLTDKVWKDTTTGIPHDPVQSEDVRPGDTKVNDIPADPVLETAPPGDPDTPTPPPPGGGSNPPPATGGGTDVCDFGPTGCTDPQTGAPTLEEPSTGIMDPIFDWLPDLPSISLNTGAAECPVWPISLHFFGGEGWDFEVNSHCELVQGSFSGALSALMVALWGLAAALIVLRA